ncbi:fungal-specific transcription factor domain-containing protein [Lasiosphaeris hirsuta]|uniref:Fungal-specific transcription factor domain-containing protein n=1 Tax=Lasiosphaeris hirsuta TaxID=260670 RepID=A0AA40E6T4_9PEZI|nr:fungal-specific transcription factor domain-containing protein [Lasiosphaeris hirsuta]
MDLSDLSLNTVAHQPASGHTPASNLQGQTTGDEGRQILRTSLLSCLQCRDRKIKCDRKKPCCVRCANLGYECVFPGSRQKSTVKRSNVSELETRVARLEEQMGEIQTGLLPEMPILSSTEFPAMLNWDQFEMELDTNHVGRASVQDAAAGRGSYHEQQEHHVHGQLDNPDLFEQLLQPQQTQDLTGIYFDKVHHTMPMLHKSRYLASLRLPQHVQPPMCLQYTVMALAAAVSETHSSMAMPLYQLGRANAESDEMKGQGDHFSTVAHAQCWTLIANFEAQHQIHARASASLSRGLRIAQMLGLHQLDDPSQSRPSTLPDPIDWCETEERRRTWWVIFCLDRFVNAITGWPTLINEQDISTLLPASEEAFDHAVEESTNSPAGILSPAGSSYSLFAGRVLAAHLFHRTIQHTLQIRPDDEPENIKNGPYWDRHRRIDNDLAYMLLFPPDSFRLRRASRSLDAVSVIINIQTCIICIHRAALVKIAQHNLPKSTEQRHRDRLLPAAEEIVRMLKMMTEIEPAIKHPLIAFSTYMAASVFLRGFVSEQDKQSEANLDFLLDMLIGVGSKNTVIRSLAVRLAMDMKRSGISRRATDEIDELSSEFTFTPLLAISGAVSPLAPFCQGKHRLESEQRNLDMEDSGGVALGEEASLAFMQSPDVQSRLPWTLTGLGDIFPDATASTNSD